MISRRISDEGRRLLSVAARSLVLRRRKKDVVSDLPPRLETVVRLTPNDEQKAAYRQLAFQARSEVSTNAMTALAWLMNCECQRAIRDFLVSPRQRDQKLNTSCRVFVICERRDTKLWFFLNGLLFWIDRAGIG